MTTVTEETTVTAETAQVSGSALFMWRRLLGVSREMFARLAGCSERSLAKYEDLHEFPPDVRSQLTQAVRLLDALSEIIPGKDLPAWLDTPNRAFAEQTPLSLVEEGKHDVLWQMIHQTRQAAFA